MERPRLTQLLDEVAAAAIVVNAPAGYGKTMLVTEWLAGRPNVAWLAATPVEADIAAFALAVADAIASVLPGAGERLRKRVLVPGEQLARPLAELLAEDLEAWPADAWLVIDDYHVLMESPTVEEFVDALLALGPLKLVATTRRRPGWATARRMLYGEVVELGAEELAMTDGEAAEAIGEKPPRALQELVRKAQGWPALIGLSALATNPELPRGRTSSTLFRYFADEVLRQQPADVQQFMLAASVPDVLTAGVAAGALGLRDADATLQRLADDGLLAPSGEAGHRFHPLLREFLRKKLEAEQPQLAADVTDRMIASARSDGRWQHAFELAVDSGRLEDAGAIAAEAAPVLLAAGRIETLEKWLAACGAAALDQPALSLAEAEVLIQRGRPADALPLALHVAQRLADRDPLASRAWAAAGQATRLTWDDERALEYHLEARRTATTGAARSRALYGLIQAAGRLELDELTGYVDELETLAHDIDGRLQVAAARYHSARLSGTLNELGDEFNELAAIADRANDPLAVIYFLAAASSHAILRGDYGRARTLAERALATCDRFRVAHPLALCVHMRAEAEIGLGAIPAAREAIEQLATIMRRHVNHPSALLVDAALRLKLALAEGNVAELPDRLDRSLETQLIRSWVASYRSLVAIVAAGVGDLERSDHEARQAEHLTRAVDVRFTCRFADVIAAAQAGGEAGIDAADAVLSADRAGVADIAGLATRAYPPLLELVAGDEAATAVLRRVLSGGAPAASKRAAARSGGDERPALTGRERDVLRLLEEGLSNAEIAARLVITRGTVKVHLHHIFEKLGAKDRLDAVVRARRLGAGG